MENTPNVRGELACRAFNAHNLGVMHTAQIHSLQVDCSTRLQRAIQASQAMGPLNSGSDAEAAAGGDDAICGLAGDAQQAAISSNGSEGEIDSDDARTPDDVAKVARVQLEMPRRSLQVTFTCDRCGGTFTRPPPFSPQPPTPLLAHSQL